MNMRYLVYDEETGIIQRIHPEGYAGSDYNGCTEDVLNWDLDPKKILFDEQHFRYYYDSETNKVELRQHRVYTDEDRTAQRRQLYADADEYIAECQNYIELDMDADGMWASRRTQLLQYKMDVRKTVSQSAYPVTVTYPLKP